LSLQRLLPWASRSAAALPRLWAEALADGAGRLACDNAHPSRARLAANLQQATGRPVAAAPLRGAFQTYARYYLAFMRLAHQPPRRAVGPYRFVDDAALAASVARGRGTLVLSAHLGNWDLVGIALAERWGDVCIYAERVAPQPLFEFYRRVRARHGVHVVPTGAPSRAPQSALRRNGILACCADRPFGARLAHVPLGIGMIAVPAGGIALALRAGAGIHTVFAVREQGEFMLRCSPDWAVEAAALADESARVQHVSARFAAELAQMVARHPDQWCQLHALVPREERAA
jgi:KDO2-lipid IV(A) lauroyltransferase